MRIMRATSFSSLVLATILALTACGGSSNTAAEESSPISSASQENPFGNFTRSADPSASSSTSTSADSSSSSSDGILIEPALATINEFINSIYGEGSEAEVRFDLYISKVVESLPDTVDLDDSPSDRDLISTIDESSAQTILDSMASDLPYYNLFNTEGMSVQDKVALFLTASNLSVSLNGRNYQYENFREAPGFTQIEMNGTDKIVLKKLTSDTYLEGKNVGTSNPEENYDFALVQTDNEWLLDGATMLDILGKSSQQDSRS